jgi:hypothetical protein
VWRAGGLDIGTHNQLEPDQRATGLGAPAADRWEGLYAEHQELLDAFGNTALSLARWPTDVEFVRAGELIYKLGSLKRALRAFVQGGGAKDLSWGDSPHGNRCEP